MDIWIYKAFWESWLCVISLATAREKQETDEFKDSSRDLPTVSSAQFLSPRSFLLTFIRFYCTNGMMSHVRKCISSSLDRLEKKRERERKNVRLKPAPSSIQQSLGIIFAAPTRP